MQSNDMFATTFLLLALPLIAVFVWSIFWAKEDAEKRGKSGWLAALMVFLLPWPGGIVVWLLIRPESKERPPLPSKG